MVKPGATSGLTPAVAGRRCRSGWHPVLVPLDPTGRSLRGLDHAVALAMAMRARISLLHVVVPDVHPLTKPVRQFQLPQVMADAQRKLVRLETALRRPGLAGEVRVCVGLPAEEIAAARLDAVFMSFTLELFDTPEIPQVLRECLRVLRPSGRLVVVSMSKDGDQGPLVNVFEWAQKHFPNFIDCRPIYARAALEQAGFRIAKVLKKRMWIPVEVVMAAKEPFPTI